MYENVAAHETLELAASLDIPIHDDYNPAVITQLPSYMRESLQPSNFPLVGKFSASFFGQIAKVWYVLRVIVKHDSWNEWGEGKSIDFPIKILSHPIEI